MQVKIDLFLEDNDVVATSITRVLTDHTQVCIFSDTAKPCDRVTDLETDRRDSSAVNCASLNVGPGVSGASLPRYESERILAGV